MTLILRGHHLLCLQGFQGYGYNDSFVENMTKINEQRKKDNIKIKVIFEADDLCKSCPNLKNNLCQNKDENKKIETMDLKVLEKLPKKDYFYSNELFKLVNNKFNSIADVKDICLNCKWWEVCLFVKNLENR